MSFGTRLLNEPVRSLAAGSIQASYANVGTPLAYQARILVFQNLTDAGVMISLDGGLSDAFPLAANGVFVLDIASDRVDDNGLFLAKGTQIKAKRLSGAASTSSLYVSCLYAFGDNN